MAKKYSVTPRLPANSKVYVATYRTASGRRVNRSLQTDNHGTAVKRAVDLTTLWVLQVKDPAELPENVDDEIAVKLYFGAKRERREGPVPVEERDVDEYFAQAEEEAQRFPEHLRSRVIKWLVRMKRDRRALEVKDLQIAKLAIERDEARRRVAELERTAIIQEVAKTKRVPAIAEALEEFEQHLASTTTAKNTSSHAAVAKRFVESLPDGIATLADVGAEHIAAFLDARARDGEQDKPLSRRRDWHLKLGRLINWSAERWDYPSQMRRIRFPAKARTRRERGEIRWHSIDEVEAAIEAQADDYWRALVATLGYGGLQLAELCWLRTERVEIAGDGARGRMWITSETDPVDPSVRHLLKTANRERHVNLHARYLLPRIRAMLDQGLAGEHFFFSVPAEKNRRHQRSKAKGSPERWLTDSLSTVLRGHKGGAVDPETGKPKRGVTAGILPAGMTAASLRHTFGSLLIRAGKSEEQVAAALGNTADVVREHYARILGKEVDVDF